MHKKVYFRGREHIITLLDDGKIKVDDYVYDPLVVQETKSLFRVSFGEYQFNLEYINGKLLIEGEEIDIEIKPHLKTVDTSIEKHEAIKAIVRAPIPGKIIQILIDENDIVNKGQQILILEAMKMKNRILSPIAGKIMHIYIRLGENVKQDQKLVKIENQNK